MPLSLSANNIFSLALWDEITRTLLFQQHSSGDPAPLDLKSLSPLSPAVSRPLSQISQDSPFKLSSASNILAIIHETEGCSRIILTIPHQTHIPIGCPHCRCHMLNLMQQHSAQWELQGLITHGIMKWDKCDSSNG